MRSPLGIAVLGLCVVGSLWNKAAAQPASGPTTKRTRSGLQVLYDFRAASGAVVKDRSGVGQPVDLRIADLKAVRRFQGALEVRRKTRIDSSKPATRVIDALRRSGEISVEVWLRTAATNQSGPARIVTLSKNPNERNFTLGQDGDHFDARLRTTRTSTNGIPSLTSPNRTLNTKLTHVVYTRERGGRAKIYINGKRRVERTVAGNMSNWQRSFRLGLANELSNDRPWLGTLYLVAIYNRDLSPKEIEQNFRAGAGPQSPELVARKNHTISARLFKAQVMPLLERRCLECHGWKSKRGRLDLSRKETAFQRRVIVPGDAEESLLWQTVKSGEMPKKRTPLSPEEKKLLRQWLDTGAVWTVDVINPPPQRLVGANWIRRLTVAEYIETVRSAVGVDIAKDARKLLPRDLRADGFSNTAYNLNVDLKHVEAYGRLAQLIVGKMDVGKFATKYTKSKKLDDANMRRVIAGMGKWLLRGPLTKDEVNNFLKISRAVAKEKGIFQEAVSFVAEAMLQSPRFIYRIENQLGDGKTRRVGNYELASRLSYILWGGPPDEELLRAADSGALAQRNQVAEHVQRMLKDPRAIRRSTQFLAEWLDLERLDNLRPNPKHFPQWNAQLAADMRDETLTFFQEVAWKQKRPLTELLNAQLTFATPRLAKHYGLKPHGEGLTRYDLSAIPSRGGLLTQGSVLTIGGDEASMVARGLFVMHELLDGHVDDPPPCVDTTPVPTKPGLSQRGASLVRLANVSCTACHSKFEPLAFGLEKFDGLGSYHEKDHHGNKLREDGDILFPGQKKAIAYKSSAELMKMLAGSRRVRETITRKITQWALGRPLVARDEPILARIHETVRKTGGTYEAVITAIVMSDLVQLTRTEKK